MKQFLTPEDLKKASQVVREDLVEFCKNNNIYTWKRSAEQLEKLYPDPYNLPLFSIGQLVQYLFEHNATAAENGEEHWEGYPHRYIYLPGKFLISSYLGEFIDGLWEAICIEGEKDGK